MLVKLKKKKNQAYFSPPEGLYWKKNNLNIYIDVKKEKKMYNNYCKCYLTFSGVGNKGRFLFILYHVDDYNIIIKIS